MKLASKQCKFLISPSHSHLFVQSDMGPVHNLIGMTSDGYVPKFAVHNKIAIYNFFFKKNIWAKYYVLIIQFINDSKIYSTILPCQVYGNLQCCMLWHWIRDSSALLQLLFYEQFSTVLKPIMIRQMAMSTHISRFF